MIDRSFGWLGRFPLAVDLADTIRVTGSVEVDLLGDDEALSAWIHAEVARFPTVMSAMGRLDEVQTLRGAVRDLLFARAGNEPLPGSALERVNNASAGGPSFQHLSESGQTHTVEVSDDAFAVFSAAVARSTMEVLAGVDHDHLAVCRAPSCGMLFVRASPRQRWCSSSCGNRARVARHAARARNEMRADTYHEPDL